jgi:hypothetical protein
MLKVDASDEYYHALFLNVIFEIIKSKKITVLRSIEMKILIY